MKYFLIKAMEDGEFFMEYIWENGEKKFIFEESEVKSLIQEYTNSSIDGSKYGALKIPTVAIPK